MNILMYAVVNIVLSAFVLLGIYYIWYRQNSKIKYDKVTYVPDYNKFVRLEVVYL